jgi:hypothetical protein
MTRWGVAVKMPSLQAFHQLAQIDDVGAFYRRSRHPFAALQQDFQAARVILGKNSEGAGVGVGPCADVIA